MLCGVRRPPGGGAVDLSTVMLLKVSARSSPNAVAGAIAGVLRDVGAVRVQVIGAGALNQAVKAVAMARAFVADDGINPVCVPEFRCVDVGGETRTAIRISVLDCHRFLPDAPSPDGNRKAGRVQAAVGSAGEAGDEFPPP
ncbi:MAG: stage V sporulation protein S [Acidobacteria bacterium]|nr:stage V sporulation protein S [Acidobacteriota bacterium]